MTTDFYPILLRAIRSLDPDTPAGRIAVYDRARQMLESHLRSRNASPSEARAEQSALESAIQRIEAETAEANKPLPTMDTGVPARTGALWTLLESIRIIGRQPAILLVVVQAAIVEWVATLASFSLGFDFAMLLGAVGVFIPFYTSAGIWGSLIDATDGALRPLRFWIYGFKYIGRSLRACITILVLSLPIYGIYLLGFFGFSLGIQRSLSLTLIVLLVYILWASRRLLVVLPAIFASGETTIAKRIIRERGGEVTVLWLSLIPLSCIFIATGLSLVLLTVSSATVGVLQSVFDLLTGASPTSPFAIPGVTAPTIHFANPGASGPLPTAPTNTFLILSRALELAGLTLWNLFQTFLCLASLVYYRSAGGSAAWFSLGATRPIRPAKPAPGPSPASAVRTTETPTASPLRTEETPTEKMGHRAAERALRQAVLAVDWTWLRVPDFRPLLTGKLLPHLQFLLATPERAISAWPPDISPRAAGAIPVVAFTLLGLAAMIGRGGGLGACLVGAIFGFAFGIFALHAGAAFERRVIARKASPDIDSESSELDLSVASVALCLGAVFTLLVTVLWRVSFFALPLIATIMLSGLSIGMTFSPAVSLFIARRLDERIAVGAAAAITVSIVFAWMLFIYLL
jgi:hypothetical protein